MLDRARASILALCLGVLAWASGCATAPQPMVDPGFGAGTYAPTRIALLPPDVFVVVDQVGDNDPAAGAALGQAVSGETVRAVEQALRARGYDVDLSARWDGIVAQDGSVLMGREELGGLANGILQFANSPAGGGQGPLAVPVAVAPELAARAGWATQSDALLYVNVKGVTTTPGKRAAGVLAIVFIVVIIAAIIAVAIASKSGGGNGVGNVGNPGGGWHGQPVARAAAPGGGGFHGVPVPGGRPPVPSGGGWRGLPPGATGGGAAAPLPGGAAAAGGWRGGRPPPPLPPGTRVYGVGPHVDVGLAVVVPLDGPTYTHDGRVDYDDPLLGDDEMYVSMTLVSTYDGRVLWHARDHLDLEAEDNRDVDQMVQTFLATLPWRVPPPPQAARK
jgi:hypothetical protein